MSRIIFDPICGQLEDFYNLNSAQILTNRAEEMRTLIEPLRPHFDTKPSTSLAFSLLKGVFKRAEDRFRYLCENQSIDDLMAILRRAPKLSMGGENWLAYLSLGMVKYTNPIVDTTLGVRVSDSKHSMIHAFTFQTFLYADRISTLADVMDTVSVASRWVGKGAKFRPTAKNALQLEIDETVKDAVHSYEERRPNDFFRDQGLVSSNKKKGDILVFHLGRSDVPTTLFEPKQELTLNVNYFPSFYHWTPLMRILEDYRDAIYDLYNVSVEAIAQVICNLSANVWHSMIWPKEVIYPESKSQIKLVMPSDNLSEDYQSRMQFTFRLLRMGYYRFSRSYWIKILSTYETPWALSDNSRQQLVEEFFNGFAIHPEKRDNIDLSILRPYPLLFKAPSGEYYFDLYGVGDFLRDLIEGAKEWFSSQHGDKFTLSVKKMIEEQVSGVQIIDKKLKVRNVSGGKTECDLIIRINKKLFVVECKANAKSQQIFRGDPLAIQQRSAKLAQDYKQAEAAANAVRHEIKFTDSPIHGAWEVEFCVCTPSQEFIYPLDKFGWLIPSIPKICTPEELIITIKKALGEQFPVHT